MHFCFPFVDTAAAAVADDSDGGSGLLKFSQFDLLKTIHRAPILTGSDGLEYEMDKDTAGLDPKDRIKRYMENINQELGMGGDEGDVSAAGYTISAFFEANDLVAGTKKRKRSPSEEVDLSSDAGVDLTGSSARERNRAKRLAKVKAKKGVQEASIMSTTQYSSIGDAHAQTVTDQTDPLKVVVESRIDADALLASAEEWPFQGRCEELRNDLFNPRWEFRHGAAVALRAVMNVHGGGAGRDADAAVGTQDALNAAWLEDMAIRLLCVSSLDRFGDYAAHQVVAPVRDTCSQALGAVLKHMNSEAVTNVLKILLDLQAHPVWEVRHGGLLGVKYLVAIRPDLIEQLIEVLLPVIEKGLGDGDDDVRAAAAEALLPICDAMAQLVPTAIPQIMGIIWKALTDLDDLTVSTSSMIRLLTQLLRLSCAHAGEITNAEWLIESVPRLWSFFRHPQTAVRLAVLQTLQILVLSSASTDWFQPLLTEALQLAFQNILLEDDPDVFQLSQDVWCDLVTYGSNERQLDNIAVLYIHQWLKLLTTHDGVPISREDLLIVEHGNSDRKGTRQLKQKTHVTSSTSIDAAKPRADIQVHSRKFLIGGPSQETASDNSAVLVARDAGAQALGLLIACCPAVDVHVTHALKELMASGWGFCQHIGGLVAKEWVTRMGHTQTVRFDKVKECLMEYLVNKKQLPFLELGVLNKAMKRDVQFVLQAYSEAGVSIEAIAAQGPPIQFTVDKAAELVRTTCKSWETALKSTDNKQGRIGRCERLFSTLGHLDNEWHAANRRIRGTVASALVLGGSLPPKLTDLIKPLVDSLKKEHHRLLQNYSAIAVSRLMVLCRNREKNPSGKILEKIVDMLCNCEKSCPVAIVSHAGCSGILTLRRERESDVVQSTAAKKSVATSAILGPEAAFVAAKVEHNEVDLMTIGHRGGILAIHAIVLECGKELFEVLPELKEHATKALIELENDIFSSDSTKVTQESAQASIRALEILGVLGSNLCIELMPWLLDTLKLVLTALGCPCMAVRFKAAHCIAALAAAPTLTVSVMQAVLDTLLKRLGDTTNDYSRQGSSEALYHIVNSLDLAVIPYIVLLVRPILGRMSDFDSNVRTIVSSTFAVLVRLMPLEAGVPNPESMSQELVERKEKDREFLDQLLDSSKIEPYRLPSSVTAVLRSYQQDGLNWMHFLKKYNLHGILCDDMGLGKTLQSICIIAGSHADREAEYARTGAVDSQKLSSLIVCPATLTSHWFNEFVQFCHGLSAFQYVGPKSKRILKRSAMKEHDVIILSYETLRTEVDFFKDLRFNYCVLDEGHLIKNPNSATTLAVKKIQANHRILLSGTPIQNNVVELWSLFDFLMPGFLGTERQFTVVFARPILKTKDPKATQKEHEAGAKALDRLHKQTLPFLLRRLKEDVLDDLPPKIIQDYHCDLSALQLQLYDAFRKSRAGTEVVTAIKSDAKANNEKQVHVLQSLRYLQKLCNHPALYLTPNHPLYADIIADLLQRRQQLEDVEHSGKLVALQQLLLDCGFGGRSTNVHKDDVLDDVLRQHRCLVFAQSKTMLDMVMTKVLTGPLASVTYLRLDGSVPARSRQGLVDKFNNDPTIDLLLLTTAVGGLGLTLTGADTVIFLEHDWNPTRDLQAMDRAHRIGQKKTVNVYRLISRGTLEEKIMGLQRFKTNIAKTVISADNSSLGSMGTDQLLDLFEVSDTNAGNNAKSNSTAGNTILGEITTEMLDDDDYDKEFDLGNFIELMA